MASNYTKVYPVTMTSLATLSSQLDLSKPYEKMYLAVPTMASGSLFIQVAATTGGTYRRLQTTAGTDFSINSAATQRVIAIPSGYRFMKIENSSGATDVHTTFNVICCD